MYLLDFFTENLYLLTLLWSWLSGQSKLALRDRNMHAKKILKVVMHFLGLHSPRFYKKCYCAALYWT
jgi:hypothetical protein